MGLQTDRWVLIACALTMVIWSVNIFLSSVWLLYLNVLVFIAIFGYASWRTDLAEQLKRAWMIGMVASIVYAYIDSLLSNLRFGLITYLKMGDLKPFGEVPLALILVWGCFITVTLYFYQRLRPHWERAYPAMALTAIAVVFANIGIEWLGNAARLWNWNVQMLPTGYLLEGVPAFVPFSYGVAFLFAPYMLKNPFIGGLRCGIVLGVMRFLGYTFVRYFA